MTITSLETVACEENNETAVVTSDERIPITALPKMVWVAGGLFIANLIVGSVMLTGPSLHIDPYGREVPAIDAAASKISPFTPVVDTTKRKVRLAAKAVPVEFIVPQPVELTMSTYEASARDMQLNIPRASFAHQEFDMPVRTERAVYRTNEPKALDIPRATYSSLDISPRRTSEQAKAASVIN